VKLGKDASLRRLDARIKNALDYTAPIRVVSKSTNLSVNGVEDELHASGIETLDGLLDDMVAVLVLDTSQDMRFQFLNKLGLLIAENVLQSLSLSAWPAKIRVGESHFLNNPAAVHLQR